jgi:hypothetical protein
VARPSQGGEEGRLPGEGGEEGLGVGDVDGLSLLYWQRGQDLEGVVGSEQAPVKFNCTIFVDLRRQTCPWLK